jgi:hypothetical protein
MVSMQQVALEEPLSPELVLVLPPELRAQAIDRLGAARWSTPRPGPVTGDLPRTDSLIRTVGVVVSGRVIQLALVFIAVAALTLVLSAVANAVR